ncbi:unnamed protein product [Zymoseptoria tritici ST99CH_1A5]|uniref:Uncharacterized protein n=3 Tax=Zymoseptoria tritici TaxID=1047171 RepID=A0A1X7S8Z8_ZYMT9|nr:unnamed protein product [Zymoseptoria tritici ST99CH_3D7]SMR61822.1 unnamed protein product [Zymoseptoria tritici ST99CH_1E4]SMR64322.1 unnamed protein product [Zymoseptoria tritici ST99CH_3D1]SMY29666.1 unnamed protein product [Zymoseptoria tritici ST99CH_1A5]
MDQELLEECRIDPTSALLKYPVAFLVEGEGRHGAFSKSSYDGPDLSPQVYGPATLEIATKHLLADPELTPFVSVVWIWDRALEKTAWLADQGAADIRIYVLDMQPCFHNNRVFDAYKLAQMLKFPDEPAGPTQPSTENHKGELLVHSAAPDHNCAILATIPAGGPTIYYDSFTGVPGVMRLPVEYFVNLSNRLVSRPQGGVDISMLQRIISDVRETDEETWLDETSAKLLHDVLEDDLLDQCTAMVGVESAEGGFLPAVIIKALTIDVAEYLSLMNVFKLPANYYVPERKVASLQTRRSFAMSP